MLKTPSNSLTKDLVIFSNLGKNCLHRAKISIFHVSPLDEARWEEKRNKKYRRVHDTNV
jgi:hypothetical protein